LTGNKIVVAYFLVRDLKAEELKKLTVCNIRALQTTFQSLGPSSGQPINECEDVSTVFSQWKNEIQSKKSS